MNKNLVSVIVPVYNAEKFLTETINSLLNQTYYIIEIIIVNDGSTDTSENIIKSFKDERIKYFYQPNKGQCAALNFGFLKSKGSLIKFYDADDLLHPEAIAAQVKSLENAEEFDLSFIEWRRFYNNAIPEGIDQYDPHTIHRNCSPLEYITYSGRPPMYQCGLWLIPRALIEKAGLWAEHLSVINDTEYFSRLLAKAGILFFSEQGYTLYRTNSGSETLSSDFSAKGIRSSIKSIDLAACAYLSIEKSERINNLILQSYVMILNWAYPKHKLYSKIIVRRIRGYTKKPIILGKSGKLYNGISNLLGWRMAKTISLLLL